MIGCVIRSTSMAMILIFAISHLALCIPQCLRTKTGKRHGSWAIAESYPSKCGPRQHVVAWLKKFDEAGQLSAQAATTFLPLGIIACDTTDAVR